MAPPTPEQIRLALTRLEQAAIADTSQLLAAADPRTALVDNLFPIVNAYADGSAALAADWYDELRDQADPDTPFTAIPTVDLDEEQIRRGALWAADPLYQPVLDPSLAASRLGSVVQPAVVDPFRATIVKSQELDPAAVGYKRNSSNGCKFCVMLAGRGAVYRNNAHFASHPHCHCTAIPVFAGGDEGPEASVLQYTATAPSRTPAQQAKLREHLRRMPEPTPRPLRLDVNQPELEVVDVAADARAEVNRARRIARRERVEFDAGRVDDVAAQFGVSVDELQIARGEVAALRRRVYDEAAGAAADSFRVLDAADALDIRAPGRGRRGGEYDWLERVSPDERSRLGKRWLTNRSTGNTVDEVAERLRDVVPSARNMSDDEVIRTVWLHHNRRIEASGAIRRGKLPSARAYSGEIDAGSFAPVVESEGFDVTALFGDDLEAAGHIAQVHHQQWSDEAAHLLDSYRSGLGPPPWEMSFQSWEAEVRDLEYARDGILGAGRDLDLTPDQVRARLDELIPPELDGPGFSYEDAYSAVVTTARVAEYRVPAHAVIDWEV